MRIKTNVDGGRFEGGTTFPGGTITGPLVTSGEPKEEFEIANKRYADDMSTYISGESVGVGTIPAGRLPGFTGDITAQPGSNSLTIAINNIGAGVLNKVTVDAKGMVTSGGALTEADIPQLPFSKITGSVPDTASGYGITDAVLKSGGTLLGNLSAHADPALPVHPATKQYVESKVTTIGKKAGDLISTSSNVTPAGFFRCNGGELVKGDYAALYAEIGNLFNNIGQPGYGRPWEQQSGINTSSKEELGAFTISATSLPEVMHLPGRLVTKNRVYLIGGITTTGLAMNKVYTAPINSDGTLGAWVAGTSLPANMYNSSVILTKNRIYVIGGSTTGTTCTAQINPDGTLGAWNIGPTIPKPVAHQQCIVIKNKAYIISAYDHTVSDAINTTYVATIDSNGVLGAWTESVPFGVKASGGSFVITKNRLYYIGLITANTPTNIMTAPINSDGSVGSWVSGGNIPVNAHAHSIITLNECVYIIGGTVNAGGTAQTNTIYKAPINLDGTLGTWALYGTLPIAHSHSGAIIVKNKVYIPGGWSNLNYTANVMVANLDGGLSDYSPYYDGTITPTDSLKFRLPDYTRVELQSQYYYIKF